MKKLLFILLGISMVPATVLAGGVNKKEDLSDGTKIIYVSSDNSLQQMLSDYHIFQLLYIHNP